MLREFSKYREIARNYAEQSGAEREGRREGGSHRDVPHRVIDVRPVRNSRARAERRDINVENEQYAHREFRRATLRYYY